MIICLCILRRFLSIPEFITSVQQFGPFGLGRKVMSALRRLDLDL